MTSFFTQLYSAIKPRSRLQKISYYIVAIYLLGCVLLGGLIPYIAKQQAPAFLTEQLGRTVTLQDITINPFSLEFSLSGLTIKELDSQQTFVSLANLYGNIQLWQSMTSWSFVIENIRITQPSISVSRTQKDNQPVIFNFSDIIKRFGQTSPTTESNEPSIIPAINIGKVEIAQGVFTLNDNVTDTHINYPNINVSLSHFNSLSTAIETQQDGVNHYTVSIQDQFKGSVTLQGQFQLTPLAIQGELDVASIDLSHYWSFVDEMFDINLSQGLLSLNGQYKADLQDKNLTPINHINVSNGQIVIDHFKATHQQDEKIAIDLLAIKNINLDSQTKRVSIDEFHTENGKIKLNITPTGADLVALLLPKETELTTAVNPSPPAVSDTTLADSLNTDIEHSKTVTSDNAGSTTSSHDGAGNDIAATTNEATAEKVQPALTENVATLNKTNAETPWLVTLHKISVAQYHVALGEGIASDNIILWQLGPIDISTGIINSDLSTPIDYQFSTGINAQSVLTSTGQVDPLAQTLNAEIDFSNMLLSRLQPYIAPFINITLVDGMFSTKGRLHADAKDTLTYSGSANISQLHINDNVLHQPLLTWQAMDINQLSFDRQQAKIDIDEINFDTLFSRIIISPDRSTNISALIHKDDTSTDAKQVTVKVGKDADEVVTTLSTESDPAMDDSPKLQLSINKIGIKDSSAFFADNSLTPNFASGIEMLNGQITNLSSNPQTTASVDIAGKIDKYAPVTLKGDVNPLLPQPYLDLNLNFDKVELTSVNPYSGTYAGYYIDKGQLSLDLKYQLNNNLLVGSNHLVIDQLKLGEPSNSSLATSLPITLAVALLQDRHGVIDLGVDVTGDLDSPSFGFGSIIINALGNIITKAVTSPFSFLAGLVGDDEQMDKISFDYGLSSISTKQKHTLDKLAEALKDRPLLNLSIKGSIDLINDKQVLAETKLHQQLATTAGINFSDLPNTLSASKYPTTGPLTDALYQLFEQQLGQKPSEIKQNIQQQTPDITAPDLDTRWHIGLYNMLINHQQITTEEFGRLAHNRAKAVKAYLIDQAGIDASKVFVLESRINTEENAAEALLELQVK
ncbi:DUF748 domain-containing protein [Shewanella sp. H8]|uniref:DUF748 domain-containing protein n=1 Tax=Shewanella sp. H8 TaxID=3342676 RepID=UPI003315A561